MRCPDCQQPIMWVARENGVRVPVGVEQVPDGTHFLDKRGILREVTHATPDDVPRFAMHIECEE